MAVGYDKEVGGKEVGEKEAGGKEVGGQGSRWQGESVTVTVTVKAAWEIADGPRGAGPG
ncbi:hypothetical protein M1D55_23395 [Cupriavidus sp. JZ107]